MSAQTPLVYRFDGLPNVEEDEEMDQGAFNGRSEGVFNGQDQGTAQEMDWEALSESAAPQGLAQWRPESAGNGVGHGATQGLAQQSFDGQGMVAPQWLGQGIFNGPGPDTAQGGSNGWQNRDAPQQRITATHNRGFVTIRGLSREDFDLDRPQGPGAGHGGSNGSQDRNGCVQQ